MNIVAQLIDKKTGKRTRPVTRTREDFANALRDMLPPDQHDKAYVLVLADDSIESGSMDFATAPLMTVETFIKHFSTFNLDGE